MSVAEKLKEKKYDDALTELKDGEKAGVSDAHKEYENDRTIRDTQVGKRQDKRTKTDVVKVAKIPIPFQRRIVKSAAVFLFGSPVKLVPSDSNNAWEQIDAQWSNLRMDSLLLQFCRAVKSETEAAIVFYYKQTVDGELSLRAKLIDRKAGQLYTNFDEYGDLTALGWQYTTKNEEGEEKEAIRVWTAEKEVTYIDEKFSEEKINVFGKIPAVYLSQDHPEWWEVQEMIDRVEMTLSKFADTNDYFAHPMFKAKGDLKSMPQKDETGKMVKLPIVETINGNLVEADIDFLTWDHAPEAIKMEIESWKDLIYGLSDTPDLSFNNVKGIGNISGIALKLMFLGPILKAKWDEGDYSVVISRCINIIKAGLINVTRDISENESKELFVDINFTSILPDNIQETISMLMDATGGQAIMSQETAVSNNPLVDDNAEELTKLREEESARASSSVSETFNL